MAHIYQLPDLCIQEIFSYLSNGQLLLLRVVCHHWLAQQQLNSKSRRTLILLQGDGSPLEILTKSCPFDSPLYTHQIIKQNYLKRNLLKLAQIITPESVQFVIQNYPKIQTLFFLHRSKEYEFCATFSQLLQHYSLQLRTLKLYLDFKNYFPNMFWVEMKILSIVRNLDSLKCLKHLTLYAYAPTMEPKVSDLTFLKQLRQFYCYQPMLSVKWFEALETLFKQNGISDLKQIGFGAKYCTKDNLKALPQLANQFATHLFTHLSFPNALPTLFAPFESLVSVYYSQFTTLNNFVQFFKPLTKLVHVRFALDNSFCLNSFNEEMSSMPKLTTFSTVKVVNFVYNYNRACPNIESKLAKLSSMFPCVESIRIVDLRWKKSSCIGLNIDDFTDVGHFEQIEILTKAIDRAGLRIQFDKDDQLFDKDFDSIHI